MTAEDYYLQTVRTHDPDRFLLSLYLPPAARPALWALYAFNYEVAKTRSVVTDTQLGLIRLQWWRDAIGEIYDGKRPRDHQVIKPLAEAIKAHDLPREDFETLIYAREFDVEDRQPANMDGLIHYADYTSAPLVRLALQCLGQTATPDAVRSVSVGYALTGILRATPYHLRHRQCYLPQGLKLEALYEGKELETLKPIVAEIAAETQKLLNAAPRRNMPKILRVHSRLAHLYLGQIKKAGFDVFAPCLQVPPFLKEIRLLLDI